MPSSSAAAPAAPGPRAPMVAVREASNGGDPRVEGARLERVPFIGPLVAAFGWQPVAGVGLIFFVIRGILASALSAVQLPYYHDVLGVTESSEYQRCTSVVVLAWAAKPGIGLLADSFPLWGYYKRSYMVLCSVITTACSVVLGMLAVAGPDGGKAKHHGSNMAIVSATVLFFLSSLGTAMVDLLTESIYAVLMRRRRDTGSSIVTWCWMTATAGSIIAVTVAGPLADSGRVSTILGLMAALSLLTVFPPAFNWFDEKPVPPQASVTATEGGEDVELVEVKSAVDVAGSDDELINLTSTDASGGREMLVDAGVEGSPASARARACALWERMVAALGRSLSGQARHQPKVAVFAIAMTVCTVVAAIAGMALEVTTRLLLLTLLVVGLVPLSFECLPRLAAKGNIFMFCSSVLYVQIPGALDYFFTAGPRCVPGGPHFDYTYYTTFTGVIGALASGLGVALFERFLSHRRYTSVFYFTTGMKIVASVFDLMLVTRWNKHALGLSDKAVYLWGDAVVFTAASMLDFMPMVVLTSRLCPHGVEALMYAILAGFSNFGQNYSRTLGELFIRTGGIKTSIPCDFSALPIVIVIAHGVLPLLTLPCAYWLLPSSSMAERLLDVDVEGPTDSSDSDGTAEAQPHVTSNHASTATISSSLEEGTSADLQHRSGSRVTVE